MVSVKSRCIVWARGAGRCYLCNKLLIGDFIANNEDANFGFVAHIVGEKPTSPRGHPTRSQELADDPSNLMLMCYPHHKLIDVDEVNQYPEDRLLQIKRDHENRVATLTEIAPDRASHVLRYGAKIGKQESPLCFASVRRALVPHRYPADGSSIDIEITGSVATDGHDLFWSVEPVNLEHHFETQVRSRIVRREIPHLSVFALAPIPLLVKLGALLGDIVPADVYQLHREPPGWIWVEDTEPVTYNVDPPTALKAHVALKLGLSATITDERIYSVLGEDTSIWSVTVANPHNDVIRRREDLAAFRKLMRRVLNDIKAAHGETQSINVFPAIPVSPAVELGRVRMPKADLPFVVFDQLPGEGFVRRLEIK